MAFSALAACQKIPIKDFLPIFSIGISNHEHRIYRNFQFAKGNALSLALVAFLALRLHQRLRVLPAWQQGASIFLLVVLDRALSFWVAGIQGMPTEARAIWAPAVTSTVLWPWLFVVLRDVRRRYHVS